MIRSWIGCVIRIYRDWRQARVRQIFTIGLFCTDFTVITRLIVKIIRRIFNKVAAVGIYARALGLVVWLPFRVRQVPGSIPGVPLPFSPILSGFLIWQLLLYLSNSPCCLNITHFCNVVVLIYNFSILRNANILFFLVDVNCLSDDSFHEQLLGSYLCHC